MQILRINRDNAGMLFDYWNKIGENIPYFYKNTYQAFIKSLFDDTYEGMTIFRTTYVFAALEDGQVKGFIQYGLPAFHFTEAGKITENINIGVIRSLYYDAGRIDIGKSLLDLSLDFFKDKNIKNIHAFYHAMGMSCNGHHGKLHEKYDYIGNFLCNKGFEVEHENIFYIYDMKGKSLKYPDNTGISLSDLEDNRQKFLLIDQDNKAIGSAVIVYIDNLTGLCEKDIIYLAWIGIDKEVKGKGLGTEFLNHIISYCLKKGYRYLHTDTAINNKTAQRFYERNGFINSGITRSYILKTIS
ncbi:MAG: GNAT family N-acetyltransferase [Clostridiales bacterium]|nr:GNAT family N-acetyltransferase [Clostridiales bacterium]